MKKPRKGFYWRWDIPKKITIESIIIAHAPSHKDDEGGMVTFKKNGHWYSFTFNDPYTVIKRNNSSPDWKWE